MYRRQHRWLELRTDEPKGRLRKELMKSRWGPTTNGETAEGPYRGYRRGYGISMGQHGKGQRRAMEGSMKV